MVERIALKLLSQSDVTFFEAQFRRRANNRQKAINLNADVFTGEFYPDLEAIGSAGPEIPVNLKLLGPVGFEPYRIARSITKSGEGYKNWRLDGEFVRDPDQEPNRFGWVEAGDIALMEFTGEPQPSSVTLLIVGAADQALHRALHSLLQAKRKTMRALSRSELATLVEHAGASAEHPIRLLLRDDELEADLEEAAFGGAPAVAKLRSRRIRRISAADMARARSNAELVGAEGEALLALYLDRLKQTGEIEDVMWVSRMDAAASWDFEVRRQDDVVERLDAKSTRGPFERPFHLSGAEVVAATEEGVRYGIARVFSLDADGAKVRFTSDIGSLARSIVAAVTALPNGVVPNSFSIDPRAIAGWGDEQVIVRPEEPDGD